jgi:hypothetical protein
LVRPWNWKIVDDNDFKCSFLAMLINTLYAIIQVGLALVIDKND